MTHAESDGIGEMLEGAHRAVLTGVQRWLELLNRRHADRAAIAARIAQRSVEHDLAHRRTVQAVASKAESANTPIEPGVSEIGASAIRAAVWETSTPDEWERAELHEVLMQWEVPDWDVDTKVDSQAKHLGDWKVEQAQHDLDTKTHPNVFEDRYYRTWAVMEATDAQLARAEERVATLLAQAPAGASRSPMEFRSHLHDELGEIVAADAHTAHLGSHDVQDAAAARRVTDAPSDLAAADRVEHAEDELEDLTVRQQHDSHDVRVARAEQLAAENFEPDVTEAAMIHDLSFGTPASQAATAAQSARKPARSARTANRPNSRQRSISGR